MGVYMIPNSVSTSLEAIENTIVSHVANSTGVLARTLGSFVNKAKVIGNGITLTASGTIGIACYSIGSGFEWDRVEIAGNSILTGGYGISISDTTDGHTRGNILTLRDNHVTGAFSDSAVVFGPGSTIKTIVIGGSIDLANAAALATGFVAASHANLNIDGLKILNRATGSALAYSASSAKGTMRNIALIGVARTNLPTDGSGHMGFQAPTGVPAAGISAFVQCLATSYYTPSGGFTTEGWASDGTNWTAKKAAA